MLVRTYRRFFAVVVVVLAAAPLLLNGYPAGHDWSFELTRAREYSIALRSGQWPPYYASNLYGGYGSPIFLYYPPLYLFFVALLQAIAPLRAAAGLVGLGLMACGALGMGVLGRAAGWRVSSGRVAIVVFLLSPYYLANFYYRNANAEFAALSLAPFVFAGLLYLPKRPGRGLAYLTFGLAGVILAHGLTALSVAAMLAAGAPVVYGGRAGRRTWWRWVAGVGLACGMSAFYWLPATGLRERIRLEDLQRGKFVFENNFHDLTEIFSYGVTETAGLLVPLILITTLAILIHRFVRRWNHAEPGRSEPDRRRLMIGCLAGSAVFVYLNLAASRLLWEHIPFLSLYQFPTRFLGPLGLLAAILAGTCYESLSQDWTRARRRVLEVIVLVVALVNVLPLLLLVRPLSEEQGRQVERGAPGGTTVYNEYVPRGAVAGIWQLKPAQAEPLVTLPPGTEARWTRVQGTLIEGTVSAERDVRLSFARWSLPDWTARVDGRPVPLSKSKFGTLEMALPAGTHTVSLILNPPDIRGVTNWISLTILILLVLGWILVRRFPGRFAGLLAPDPEWSDEDQERR